MTTNAKTSQPPGMTGSVAANFHEGSRSEYLAQYVFSSLGTAIPVPHQEDSGLDIYCTLLEREGQRAWPRAYYSVQVKSKMTPWVFEGPESVRWIIEHPLPIFLCVVTKSEARIRVYHTSPRFAVWALPIHPTRLELIPGTETKASTLDWKTGDTFTLKAPILDFTIQDALDDTFHTQLAEVLKFWIDYDMENLLRIRSGIHRFWGPADYETNTTKFRAWTGQGGRFRPDSLPLAQRRLKELLGLFAQHYYDKKDLFSAAIIAIVLRYLDPNPNFGTDEPSIDTTFLQMELNKRFGMSSPQYIFQACDSMLNSLKEELARHDIHAPGETTS